LQIIFLTWLIIAAIFFTVALAMTPQDSVNGSEIFWLAVLAALWPCILTFSAIGMLFTLLASLTHGSK
jgi:hypothetical protein